MRDLTVEHARIPARISRDDLIAAMRACEQARGQSVLDHGYAVAARFEELRAHLAESAPLESWWRVPDWARAPGLLTLLPDLGIMRDYLVFHDCGKPFVVETDSDGRRHFPGHAAASEAIWLAAGGDPMAARLMGMDMDAHLLRAEGVAEFGARPEATALLLAAVAEVHANAAMFGGTDSDSFKMKAKHIDKRGRQALQAAGILPASRKGG